MCYDVEACAWKTAINPTILGITGQVCAKIKDDTANWIKNNFGKWAVRTIENHVTGITSGVSS